MFCDVHDRPSYGLHPGMLVSTDLLLWLQLEFQCLNVILYNIVVDTHGEKAYAVQEEYAASNTPSVSFFPHWQVFSASWWSFIGQAQWDITSSSCNCKFDSVTSDFAGCQAVKSTWPQEAMAVQIDENYRCPCYDCPGTIPEGKSFNGRIKICQYQSLERHWSPREKERRIVHCCYLARGRTRLQNALGGDLHCLLSHCLSRVNSIKFWSWSQKSICQDARSTRLCMIATELLSCCISTILTESTLQGCPPPQPCPFPCPQGRALISMPCITQTVSVLLWTCQASLGQLERFKMQFCCRLNLQVAERLLRVSWVHPSPLLQDVEVTDHVCMAIVCRLRMAGHIASAIQDGMGQHVKCKVRFLADSGMHWRYSGCTSNVRVCL